MTRKPISPRVFLVLTAGTVVLPMAMAVVLALAVLLTAMGDGAGGLALRYVALGCGILWTVTLVCLVVAQALNSLGDERAGERLDAERAPGEGEEVDR